MGFWELVVEYLKVILIAIVEGITEWLPVSSTGHMILVEKLFPLKAMSTEFYSMFLYVIQLAAILAVIVFFFGRLNPFSKRKSEADKKNTWHMWFLVLIGVIPAGVIGLLLDDFVDEHVVSASYGAFVVAAMLIIYGVIYVWLERSKGKQESRVQSLDQLTVKQALAIGLFQCLSIIPGTSRSGSTILGGMTLGVSRVAAAEYSFFMAIPIMLGVSLLKVAKFAFGVLDGEAGYELLPEPILLLLIGFVGAFVVSLFVIRFLLDFVRRHSFECFGWYRILLGVFVLLWFLI